MCIFDDATIFRWLKYTPMGKRIEGTRFIAFKVPLMGMVCKQPDLAAIFHSC